jgi:putative two-component system response regulator
MDAEVLVNMIDSSAMDLDGHGLEDLVSQFVDKLPSLLRSTNEKDFQLAERAVRSIAYLPRPEPIKKAIGALLDVAYAMAPRGRAHDAIPLAERAVDLSHDHAQLAELRRAYNIYGVVSTDAGIPARGVECALRSIEIARKLQDERGVAAAQSNLTAALYQMGLYRECIDLAEQISAQFDGREGFAAFVGIARANMATASLALLRYEQGAETARRAAESLGLPKQPNEIFNRLATETTWLRCAIGMNDTDTASIRLRKVKALAEAFKTPRTELNKQLSEAAWEIFAGDLTIAVAKLLKLLETSKAMPTLYRDNLALLVRAYEKAHDHTGVLIYLGKLVEFLAKSQVDNVKRALDALKVKVQTPLPGKDDVQDLIAAIQRDGSLPRKDVEVPEPMYRDAFERLAVTAELREDTWGKHAYRVGRLAYLLAEELGYGHRFCEEIELAARLHDIGKLGIPDGLLLKPGKLSPAEFEIIKRHTSIGGQLLSLCPNPAFRMAETIAVGHHEKWDGSGYPSALKGDAIPDVARIAAVADVYDALTHVRAYKHAWEHSEAVAEIARCSGTHFEPRIVDAFVKMIERVRTKYGKKFENYLSAPSSVSTLVRARREMQDMLDAMYRIDEEVARQQAEAMHDPKLEVPQKLATVEEQKIAQNPPDLPA